VGRCVERHSDDDEHAELERANEDKFQAWSRRIHDELLRRAKAAADQRQSKLETLVTSEPSIAMSTRFAISQAFSRVSLGMGMLTVSPLEHRLRAASRLPGMDSSSSLRVMRDRD